MDWQLTDVGIDRLNFVEPLTTGLVVVAALAALILVLRYARAIIRTLMFLGGLLFLAIAAVALALALGWWEPSLVDLLKAVGP